VTGKDINGPTGENNGGKGGGGSVGSKGKAPYHSPAFQVEKVIGVDSQERNRTEGETSRSENGSQTRGQFTGECVCPECGRSMPHRWGVPCREHKCPECGTGMIRK
jgi:hypothetical protein